MFGLSFTTKDLVRALWSFVFGALAYIVVVQPTTSNDWKAALAGAVAAGLSAVKNLVLADGSTLKG
jgi:ferric-dicitrate binding protein FerR (iron transport regulator)